MKYNKIGKVITLEENGLVVKVDYDFTIEKINEEISGSYIYEEAAEDNCLYGFGKKDVKLEDYQKSLEDIKGLIDNIFTEIPTINVFDFIALTKKGKFKKNQVVKLAAPIAGLFRNYDYYKYIECYCLTIEIWDENTAIAHWGYIQSDVNKFDPIFFEDYSTPIIREKLKSIRKADLKAGHIYSDEKQKKYYLYLGKGLYRYTSIYKPSKTLLPITDFSDEEIIDNCKKEIEEDIATHLSYGSKFNPYQYLYIRLTKREFETLKKDNSKENFEKFIKEYLSKRNSSLVCYDNVVRVFHDEYEYLEDVNNFSYVRKSNVMFHDNTGSVTLGGLPKDTFSYCHGLYISFE